VGREEALVRLEDGGHEIVMGRVALEAQRHGAPQDDARLLLVADVPGVIALLPDDGEDELAVVLLAEPDQAILLTDLGLADGGLEGLLRRGRLGQERGGEPRVRPDLLEATARDTRVLEGPPEDVADLLPGGLKMASYE
jgi:hypothetical protein